MDKMLESTTPGMVWALNVYRGNRGIVASATEGRAGKSACGNFNSFETILFQDRNVNLPVAAKRLTDKVKGEAMAALVAKLVEDKMAVAP